MAVLSDLTLAPGKCIDLLIDFTPKTIGIKYAMFEIYIDGDTVRFPIQGIGTPPVGVEDNNVLPSIVRVYPNPSNGAVNFSGSAPTAMPIRMRIFDLAGNQIAHETRVATGGGEFQFVWNSSETGSMPSGNYIAVFSYGTSQTRIPFVIVR